MISQKKADRAYRIAGTGIYKLYKNGTLTLDQCNTITEQLNMSIYKCITDNDYKESKDKERSKAIKALQAKGVSAPGNLVSGDALYKWWDRTILNEKRRQNKKANKRRLTEEQMEYFMDTIYSILRDEKVSAHFPKTKGRYNDRVIFTDANGARATLKPSSYLDMDGELPFFENDIWDDLKKAGVVS